MHAHSGTFLKNITNNATLTYMARYGNSTESEGGTMDFCGAFIDSIDQPGPRRKHDCPPKKGFGLIMMSCWVMPMFIVPVSLLTYETDMCGNYDVLIRTNRDLTISNSMP